jgi:ribonuclease E
LPVPDAPPAAAEDWQPEEAAEPVKKTRRRPRARAIDEVEANAEVSGAAPVAVEPAVEATPAKPRRSRAKKAPVASVTDETSAPIAAVEAAIEEDVAPAEKPKRRSRAKKAETPAMADTVEEAPAIPLATGSAPADDAAAGPVESEGEPAPRRRGWWQSTFGG